MRKKSNPNEDDDKNKKGKNNTPKKSVIKRSNSKKLTPTTKSTKSTNNQTKKSSSKSSVNKKTSKSVRKPKSVNNRNSTLQVKRTSENEIEITKQKTINKRGTKVVKVRKTLKLKPHQLTKEINKKDTGTRTQIISSYKDLSKEPYFREEILKLNRMKSIFRILEKIGKKYSNVEVKSPQGPFKYPNNTSYRISIHQLISDPNTDYVEGIIYSKKDHIIKSHSWVVLNGQHIDYSIKSDQSDFIYYGVILPNEEVLSYLNEIFQKKVREVNQSILELCTIRRLSKNKPNNTRVVQEITRIRKKFIPQSTYIK
jgi:hypothetical protein